MQAPIITRRSSENHGGGGSILASFMHLYRNDEGIIVFFAQSIQQPQQLVGRWAPILSENRCVKKQSPPNGVPSFGADILTQSTTINLGFVGAAVYFECIER